MIFKLLTRIIHFTDLLFASNVPSSGSSAVVTLTNRPNHKIIIHRVYWSYSANGAGRLTISDGNATDFTVDITQGGPGVLGMNRISVVGSDATVTLLGIAATQGRLNVEYTVEHN